jgi:N utilization substance protein A
MLLADEDEEVTEPEALNADPLAPKKVRFNEEHHMMLEDARKIKADAQLGDELTFPLETKDDYGRIAAQTAKQVIIQRLREAEKGSVLAEYSGREGEIVNGKVQKMERGNVFVDLGRTTGLLAREEQIPGEYYRQGERLRAYLYAVEETPRGINLRLSRAHPKFVEKLFAVEAPEIANGSVVIKSIAREPGSRTKLAVHSLDSNIDPVGSCVGQRGVRVNTVISELGGEKIDIIEWNENAETFIASALAPAKINKVTLIQEDNRAQIEVDADQFSLAVGRGGQNARLAARLTGWKIDIVPPPVIEAKKPEAEAPAETEKPTE